MSREEIQTIVTKAVAGTMGLTEAIDSIHKEFICQCGESDEKKLIIICDDCFDKTVHQGS